MNTFQLNTKLNDAALHLKNAQQQLKKAQAKYNEIEKLVKNSRSSYSYVLHFPSICWEKRNLDIIRNAKSIDEAKDNLFGWSQIDEGALTYFLEGGNVQDNDVFAIPYIDYKDNTIEKLLPFIVYKVEDERAFCHCLFSIRPESFAENNSNDYGKSDIRKVLINLIDCFDSKVVSHFHIRCVNWVHPLTDEEQIFKDKFWLLDIAELYTYFKTAESRKRSYLLGSYSGQASDWWLRHPYAGTANIEYNVSTFGASTYHYSHNSFGLAPACIIE